MEYEIRMEGLTLTVADVKHSIDYYCNNFGFTLEWDAAPQFSMLRIGGANGGIERFGQHGPSPLRRMTKLYAVCGSLKISRDILRGGP